MDNEMTNEVPTLVRTVNITTYSNIKLHVHVLSYIAYIGELHR